MRDRYRFVAAAVAHHAIAPWCRLLDVSRSGDYGWRGRGGQAGAAADAERTDRIAAVHAASRGTSGSPRVHAAPHAAGVACGRRRVARLLRAAGLRGSRAGRHTVRTTVPDRAAMPAPDRVGRAFAPAPVGAPDQLWLADIREVAAHEGWLYPAVVLDAFSRRVVGWARADHLRAELAVDALALAVGNRRPEAGRVHHAERGCQYTSLAFGTALREAALLPAIGSTGDGSDNAVAERFFATRKVARRHRQHWPTRRAAQLAIFAFIAVGYNRLRRHSTLRYRRPLEHAEVYRQTAAA